MRLPGLLGPAGELERSPRHPAAPNGKETGREGRREE